MRNIHKNVPLGFKPFAWKVSETEYNENNNKNNETIFTIGNGYIGIRGFFEEGFYGNPQNTDTTSMINGVYEYFPYNHIWARPGYPTKYHAITNQANCLMLKVLVDGEEVKLSGNVSEYVREISLKSGELTREFVFTTKQNKRVSLKFARFCSQSDKHLAFMRLILTADSRCSVKLISQLENIAEKTASVKEECSAPQNKVFDFISVTGSANRSVATYKTKISGFTISAGFAEALDLNAQEKILKEDSRITITREFDLDTSPVTYERCICYATNKDTENPQEFTEKKLSSSNKGGFYLQELKKTNDIWADFWNATDIEIDSDDAVQQGIRFSLFQIYQSTGKDGRTNISANGLTGTGYSGHTFWDTEIFMMPMYIYSQPEIAKQLLMYRYNILPKAKERAQQMDDQGALYSWNSINGEECGHVFEAATAQYHINNDIFYAIYRYFEATGDEQFMIEYGAEMLFEMAKCLAHRGSFNPYRKGKFCINVICGPDEYNPVVDNNLYTNMLTKKQLYFTLKMKELLSKKSPNKLKQLIEKCEVNESEFDLWQRAADNMYLAYNEELDLYLQDDNFLYKDPIDLESIPVNKLPLLTNLHPLNLWRYQVIKQADIILLTFLLSEEFTQEMRKKIFDFYEPKTIHDSSLSAGVHSIVACDVGYEEEAYQYLKQSCRMDLDNVNRNTFFGIHAACMGSAYLMMINGYAGLRIYDGALHFKPYVADKWNNFTFKIRFGCNLVKANVEKARTTYELIEGEKLEFFHKGESATLCKDKKLVLAN